MTTDIQAMDNALTFAEWLKARRRMLDLTQPELAARANCSAATIKKIEAGDLRPSKQLAELLADALQTPPDQRQAFVHAARSEGSLLTLPAAEPTALPSAPAAPASPPAPRPAPPPMHNLPAQLTGLLGREREITAAAKLLRQDKVRLLTLSGPPGAGKTRLSIAIAEALVADFTDGVCFVPLAPVTDPALVLSAIAQALDVSESNRMDLAGAVKQFLGQRHLLLVLDNFEQVVAAAPLVKELLTTSARLKVLVSSREVLHLYGEHEFPVPPLALPDVERIPPVEALALYPAVELFVERASAVQPTFELNNANAASIARICAWLDGLPLAIEMAAAQVRWMTPERVLQQLTRQLSALTGGPRNYSPRQQTMRGAIDWSFNLLEPAERDLFIILSVFAGGCSLEAIQHVASAGVFELDAVAVEMTLYALAEKSLVRAEVGGDGEMRIWQLEVIRSYAGEHLALHAHHHLVHQRHAAWYRRLVEEATRAINGAQQAHWLHRLDIEQNNLRAVMEWSLQNEPLAGLGMAGQLASDYWSLRGHYGEGRTWLARCMEAVANLPAAQDSVEMAWALAMDGRLATAQGDGDAGAAASLASIERFRRLGHDHGRAIALRTLARIAVTRSEYQQGMLYYQEALPICLAAGDHLEAAHVLNGLGFIAKNRGDYHGAIEWYEQALAYYAMLGSRAGEAHTLTLISIAHYWQGHFAQAAEMGRRCVQMRRELGNTFGTAFALDLWGMALARVGDFAAGMAALQEALETFERMGIRAGVALVLNDIGQVAHLQGDFRQAVEWHRQAFHHAAALGEKYRLAFCLEGMALALAELAADDPQHGCQAVQLLAAAAALRSEIGSPTPPSEQPLHDAALARLHRLLTEEQFSACWRAGAQMTLDAAGIDELLVNR